MTPTFYFPFRLPSPERRLARLLTSAHHDLISAELHLQDARAIQAAARARVAAVERMILAQRVDNRPTAGNNPVEFPTITEPADAPPSQN